MLQNVLIPGAKVQRQPIFPNITKYEEGNLINVASGPTKLGNSSVSRKSSNPAFASLDKAAPLNNASIEASQQVSSPKNHQAVPGLVNKENMTFRGQLESLEQVLIDVVSEIKYHRRQLEIIKAEKDTAGAVQQMNIVNAKNSVLSDEYKLCEQIKKQNRRQDKEFENFHKQMEVLNNETYTGNTRLLQMQRRILEIEQIVGLPPQKLP